MKGSRQQFGLKQLQSPVTTKKHNLTNQSSSGDIHDSIVTLITKKSNSRVNRSRKQSSNQVLSPVSSVTLQNDLLRLFKKHQPGKLTNNISQQYFYNPGKVFKTEISDTSESINSKRTNIILSPHSRGYIKPQWLTNISGAQSPTVSPTMKEHRNTPASLASTEMDPMSIYKGKQDDKLSVVLHLNESKVQFNVDTKISKSTNQLQVFLIEAVKELDPSLTPICFTSVEKDLQLDYFLQCSGRRLTELKRKSLTLMPYCNNRVSRALQASDQAPKIGLKDFLFIKCIGVGGFSRVYLVKRLSTGRFYAMKLIDKEFIIKRSTECIVRNERDIMAVVDHPFLVRLEHSFEHSNFLVFVLEYCSGGELFQQLKRAKRMTEAQARFYFAEVCLGMLFLHQLNICYRDIKPENILLDYQGHVRIADFGLSKPNMGEREVAYSFCGSPEYMAPEMLRKEGHTLSVDHYCLGVLLYELIVGLPPFYSKDINRIYDSILHEPLTFPKEVDLTAEVKDLLLKLLAKEPRSRLGYKGGLIEILSHPWFHGISLTHVLEKKIPPPFVPDSFRFQFHITENAKGAGEMETIDKLLGRRGLSKDSKIFPDFYFDRGSEHQIKAEQAMFYKHYQTFVDSIQTKNTHNSRKEAKKFTIDTSKCSSKSRQLPNSKSPPSIPTALRPDQIANLSSGKRYSPKMAVQSQSHQTLKKMVANVFHSNRMKQELFKRNHSYQYESFMMNKLSPVNKTQLTGEKANRRGSSQQKREN